MALRLSDLLPDVPVVTGLVIGDGGREFFAAFSRARAARGAEPPDPLDRHTATVVPAALRAVLGAQPPLAVRYPFDGADPVLPMQAIGQAAGLPAPGPLGVQIHPQFGPWWAYRALALLPFALADLPGLPDACAGCPAPCQSACPGRAVLPSGFAIVSCAQHRLQDPGCQLACVARRACIVAPEQSYSDEQLAFHMAASLASVRRYFSG